VGKVWERKIIENNQKARNQGAEADAADAAFEEPLTAAELQGTLARNRVEYDRRVKRYDRGHTDRWPARLARGERFEHSGNAGSRAKSASDTAKRPIPR
jgi:hypothetical protein